ncbi:MAG: hypothetical protein K8S55_08670 [Phycisphaerae bacterium]|nr:hypothetical protein [Phycisphaerae bacterium]
MKTICVILAILGLSAAVSADTILEYDIANNTNNTITATNLATNVSAGDLGTTGVIQSVAAGEFLANDWTGNDSPDPSKYYQFTATADDGYAISYNTITFALFLEEDEGYLSAWKWELRASTDGFASSDIHLLNVNTDLNQITYADQDISALGTQSGTVTFRLYGYYAHNYNLTLYSGLSNSSTLAGTGSNVILDGTVSTAPEYTTLSVLLCGCLGLIHSAKRKTHFS